MFRVFFGGIIWVAVGICLLEGNWIELDFVLREFLSLYAQRVTIESHFPSSQKVSFSQLSI